MWLSVLHDDYEKIKFERPRYDGGGQLFRCYLPVQKTVHLLCRKLWIVDKSSYFLISSNTDDTVRGIFA